VCLDYILRKLAEIKFGVLVGIVVWFGGTIVATGMVFCACYVTLFFLQMDLARLVGNCRRAPGGIGQPEIDEIEIELDLEGLSRT
jgi:hypothetical protein